MEGAWVCGRGEGRHGSWCVKVVGRECVAQLDEGAEARTVVDVGVLSRDGGVVQGGWDSTSARMRSSSSRKRCRMPR